VGKKHYDWDQGRAEIEEHSLTKHSVLVEYLLAYFSQRMVNRRGAERFRITLVDGFCGGGTYRLRGTETEVVGSPLRMLRAVEEATLLVNSDRTKRVELDVQFLFVDKDRRAINHLTEELKQRGYGAKIDKTIHLVCSEFVDAADGAMALVRRHTPKASTAIFFLDQYGYTDVPSTVVRRIFSDLPNSEVVLTFHVASFATYTNDELADRIAETLQVDIRKALAGRTIDDLKQSDADWRRFIQGALYQALVTGCGARYFTPFFIRGSGSGQKFDGGFRFDDVARHQSDAALREQLGKLVLAQAEPKRLGDIYASTCNGSPATAYMYKVSLESLASEGAIVITSSEGKRRRLARYMADGDFVEANRQARFLFSS